MARRLVLVGLLVLVSPGSLVQLTFGTLAALVV